MQEKMPDVPREKLSEQLAAIDKARKKYCAYFTGREFGVADSYDICLNASALGLSSAWRFSAALRRATEKRIL